MRNNHFLTALSEARAERDTAHRLLRQLAQLSGKYRERAYEENHPELLALVDDIDDLLSLDWRTGGSDA